MSKIVWKPIRSVLKPIFSFTKAGNLNWKVGEGTTLLEPVLQPFPIYLYVPFPYLCFYLISLNVKYKNSGSPEKYNKGPLKYDVSNS